MSKFRFYMPTLAFLSTITLLKMLSVIFHKPILDVYARINEQPIVNNATTYEFHIFPLIIALIAFIIMDIIWQRTKKEDSQ